LGESGFLDRKKASVTIPTQLPEPTRAIAKIPPTVKPSVQIFASATGQTKVSWIALGGCGSLVEVHGGSEGSLQHRTVDAGKVPFGNYRWAALPLKPDIVGATGTSEKCHPADIRS
jgi:hypothetical protein